MAIRPKTELKSAAPRSGVPKGDLEQYGVWVKAEPQDIVEEAAAPPVAEESFLSPDEEKLLGSFDAEFDLPGPGEEPDLSTLPSIDDMPTIESSLLDESPSPKTDEIEELGSGTIDISLEDIDGLHQPSSIRPDAHIDMASVQGLDSSVPSPSMEDVSTEFLDAEPGPSASEDVTADFLDAEPAAKPAIPDAEFERLDIDLHFDDTIPHQDESPSASSLPGFEEVTEFDDFLSKEEPSRPAAEPQAFDDLAAVERDLASEAPPRPAPAPRSSSPDLSTEILLKIAEELSSIRGELVSLKTQLGDLRREAEAGAGMEAPPSLDSEGSDSRAGGFFDEEEDETIALTGDELDNILNTADFTEETASVDLPSEMEAAEAESPVDALADNDLLSETILPESGDYSAAPEDLPAIEEINLSAEEPAEAGSLPGGASDELPADFGEIGLMAEEGVTPMTAAPEDTSYLESEKAEALPESLVEEPAESEGFGELGMSNVPLVEPDLSDFDSEELEAEPLSEIEEELPLVEEASALEPDLTFQTVPEAEPVEMLAEADQSHLTGIDLHEETLAPLPEIEEIAEIETLPDAEDASLLESIDRIPGMEAPVEASFADAELSESLIEEAPAPQASIPPAPQRMEPKKSEPPAPASDDSDRLKTEIRSVLSYLDKLLDSLPEEKIEEFARSEHFDTYKRLFEELGLV